MRWKAPTEVVIAIVFGDQRFWIKIEKRDGQSASQFAEEASRQLRQTLVTHYDDEMLEKLFLYAKEADA